MFVPWVYASLSNYVAYVLFPVSIKCARAGQKFSMSVLLFYENESESFTLTYS